MRAPALPKPWMATVCSSGSSSSAASASLGASVLSTWKAPSAVAVSRPRLPPSDSGLPVTAAGVCARLDDRVLVDHPAHDHLVGVHVGRRDVGVGADQVGDPGDVVARQPLLLGQRQLLGVHRDAALGAAEGQVQAGALERHPEGQRLHLVHVHARVEADAALGGAAGGVVAHPVAGERLQRAVVHAHRHRHLQHRLGQAQALERVLGHLGDLGGGLQPGADALEQRALGL